MNIIPMLLFITVMTVTPGPNNMIITSSGTMYGYRKTSPFIFGVTVGLITQLLLTSAGLGLLFSRFPIIEKILKITGFLYISWLAFKIATVKNSFTDSSSERAPGFIKGLLFQYLNPKAYLMSITTISLYTLQGERYLWSVSIIILAYLLIAPISTSVWALFGVGIKKVMINRSIKWVQYGLGVITLLSALSLFYK